MSISRRDFLRALGIGAGIAAVEPKLIFDMGANLWKPTHEFYDGYFDFGNQYAMAISVNVRGEQYRHAIRTRIKHYQYGAVPPPESEMLKRHLLEWKRSKFG